MSIVSTVIKKVTKVEKVPEDIQEFSLMLDKLRPHYKKIEGRIQRDGDNKTAIILGDGVIIHTLDGSNIDDKDFLVEMGEIIDYYKNPPVMWPGCRGMVARHLGFQVGTVEFNRWFDQMANQLRAVA